ncbi:MAG: hypothetical protein E7464_05815 [Ruminococcaceae bacterium]|nr:hypothetical protein [Oscillospiraceae bacterium]
MDLLPEDQRPDPNAPLTVVDVMFRTGTKVYFFDPGELEVPAGANVIIDTSRGVEFGTCTAGNHTVRTAEVVMPLRKVIRIATPADKKMAEENWAKEKSAYDICLKKIEEQGLDMQLVSAEYAFDGSKILFFFTADGRVDFRELVKSLASVFHTRIELRQIGVRDKAKLIGGLGICGRPFCCSQFLDDFQPVSIKMAKVQNLSLNPTKISGTCGRLMCCLKYEQEAYEDLLRQSPKNESFVDTPDGRGTVTEVNLLRQSVKVRMEEHPEEINCYRNCDICVLRNGKAHKNDPPIPKELAPISGNKERSKPRLRTTAPSASDALEPVVLRSEKAEAEEAKPAGAQSGRRKKRGEDKPRKEQSAPAAQEPAEKPAEQQRRRKKNKGAHAERPEGEVPVKAAEKPNKPQGEKPQKGQGGKQKGPKGEKNAKGQRPEGEKQQKAPRPEGEKQQKPQKPNREKSGKPQAQAGEAEAQQPRPEGEGKPHGGNRHRNHHRRRKNPNPNQNHNPGQDA